MASLTPFFILLHVVSDCTKQKSDRIGTCEVNEWQNEEKQSQCGASLSDPRDRAFGGSITTSTESNVAKRWATGLRQLTFIERAKRMLGGVSNCRSFETEE